MENKKRTVAAVFVKLLYHKNMNRGMKLIEHESRCVIKGEIHELVTTDQVQAMPGEQIDRVGFLGFAEILNGGVVEKGDEVRLGTNLIGQVLGFDDCHFPNHYNILIATNKLLSANDLSLLVEQKLEFCSTVRT